MFARRNTVPCVSLSCNVAENTHTLDTFSELKLLSSTYAQVYQRIMHMPVPYSGHNKQRHDLITKDEEPVPEADTLLKSEERDSPLVPVAILKKILLRALSWFYTHKAMISVSETAHIQLEIVPFMTYTLGDLFNPVMLMPSVEQQMEENNLDTLLKSMEPHQSTCCL